MTAERERLLQKIKRVQALAERGVGGEKDSAAALLETLMARYDITEADISAEREELAWFRYKTELERRLLCQIIYSITGKAASGCVGANTGRTRKKVGIECTAAERLEIEISFEFFNAAMGAELERFYTAFVNKNRIFPPPNKAGLAEDPPEMSKEEIMKLTAMMDGMDTHTRRKMIESGAAT